MCFIVLCASSELLNMSFKINIVYRLYMYCTGNLKVSYSLLKQLLFKAYFIFLNETFLPMKFQHKNIERIFFLSNIFKHQITRLCNLWVILTINVYTSTNFVDSYITWHMCIEDNMSRYIVLFLYWNNIVINSISCKSYFYIYFIRNKPL